MYMYMCIGYSRLIIVLLTSSCGKPGQAIALLYTYIVTCTCTTHVHVHVQHMYMYTDEQLLYKHMYIYTQNVNVQYYTACNIL